MTIAEWLGNLQGSDTSSEEDSQVMQQDAFVQGKMEILNTFTTKGYTSWVAHEGVGAQTTLYKDGKIVGWCTDEGQGGQVDFRANTVEDRTMVFDFVKSLPKYEFNDYWKEQYGEEWEGKPELHSWNVFTFANIMLEQEERKERGIEV